MILLDNVISEAMRPAPDDTVRARLDEQAAETLYLSSVPIAELLFGIGALAAGKRKDRLTAALEGGWSCSPTASCRSMSLPQNAVTLR